MGSHVGAKAYTSLSRRHTPGPDRPADRLAHSSSTRPSDRAANYNGLNQRRRSVDGLRRPQTHSAYNRKIQRQTGRCLNTQSAPCSPSYAKAEGTGQVGWGHGTTDPDEPRRASGPRPDQAAPEHAARQDRQHDASVCRRDRSMSTNGSRSVRRTTTLDCARVRAAERREPSTTQDRGQSVRAGFLHPAAACRTEKSTYAPRVQEWPKVRPQSVPSTHQAPETIMERVAADDASTFSAVSGGQRARQTRPVPAGPIARPNSRKNIATGIVPSAPAARHYPCAPRGQDGCK